MTGWMRARPLLSVLGGVLVVLAAGLWSGSPVGPVLTGAGFVALLASLAWCLLNFWRAAAGGAADNPWPVAASAQTLFVLAAVLHAAGGYLPSYAGTGIDWPALSGGGWAVLAILGGLLFAFVEVALWNDAPPAIQAQRVRRAADAGLSLGLLLVLVSALVFVADGLNWQWDLSYFKTTRPSQATREVVEGLTQPIDVAAFFPAGDPVGQRVQDYLAALKSGPGAGAMLGVRTYDAELEPLRDDEFKVRGNGRVVLRRGEVLRTLTIGETLGDARAMLRKLDAEFLKNLLVLARQQQTVYLTVGHGERNEQGQDDRPPETGTASFDSIARAANFEVKPLGFANGLGTQVPSNAALVAIIGPRLPFRPAEVDTLRDYLRKGGRLLVFLEPQPARSEAPVLLPLLADWGLTFQSDVQANSRYYARRSFSPADYSLLVTDKYGNHPVVNTLRAHAMENPLILNGAGALIKQAPPTGVTQTDLLLGMPGTWADRNGNFMFDPSQETQAQPLLGVAVAGLAPPPAGSPATAQPNPAAAQPGPNPAQNQAGALRRNAGTALVFADADLTSDLLLHNRANQALITSSLTWLGGEESPLSAPSSEEDVQLLHASGNELAWFYVPVFLVPLLVLVLGGVTALRRGRAQRGGGA